MNIYKYLQYSKNPSVIDEMNNILGSNLSAIDLPSQIYLDGHYYDFPLSPINLIRRLGIIDSFKAAAELLKARFGKKQFCDHFESFSVYRYGNLIRNGRSSLFQYIHFHDVMAKGKEIAREL